VTRIVFVPAIVIIACGYPGCASSFAGESNGGNRVLRIVQELELATPIGQCRAVPVELGKGKERAILVVYCADAGVDPWSEMFFYPSDTLKMLVFDRNGEIHWRRELGRGVVPGIWFCPVFPFDLDDDGVDEVYFVNNTDPDHPLSHRNRRLERVDARNGETTGSWPWPSKNANQKLSYAYRNFILGGHVKGEPVLVTAQGIYEDMHLQGWRSDMSVRWEHSIAKDAPGARGSHMCPIADLDDDGIQELMWGERCIELAAGKERFCADRDVYRGHSDVIQPFRDQASGRWFIYTCRESDRSASPRVVLFDDRGRRVWGAVDRGHIDMGWIARLGDDGRLVAMAIRIGGKAAGPGGTTHSGMTEFAFDALSGKEVSLGFSTYRTVPVDIDGDARHELVRFNPDGQSEVLDSQGRTIARLGESATVVMACKFLDLPGEQLLVSYPDGTLQIWSDPQAKDTPAAEARYEHPLYRANRRLFASGSNRIVLGGI